MEYQNSEKLAYDWVEKNIAGLSSFYGGQDSTLSDIYNEKIGWIEVKDLSTGVARCGQFTEGTVNNNPYSIKIFTNKATEKDIVDFVKYHYNQKKVSYFITVIDKKINFYSSEDFYKNHIFTLQKPYEKRSGTRSTSKKYFKELLNYNNSFYIENQKIFCSNKEIWKTYFTLNGKEYFISPTCRGEVRLRGTTKNLTWHILVQEK